MKRMQPSIANVGLACTLVAGIAACSGETLSSPLGSHDNGSPTPGAGGTSASGAGGAAPSGTAGTANPGAGGSANGAGGRGYTSPSGCDGKSRKMTTPDMFIAHFSSGAKHRRVPHHG